MLAAGHKNGQLSIVDASDGTVIEQLNAHANHEVRSVAWSADSKLIRTLGADGMVHHWEAATGKRIRATKSPAKYGEFSDDAELVASDIANTLRIWNVETGKTHAAMVLLDNDQWLSVAPTGYFRHSPRMKSELVYVGLTKSGQQTYTPEQFAQEFHWQNDPDSAQFDDLVTNQNVASSQQPDDESNPAIKPGEPIFPAALVRHPLPIDGLSSWTVETHDHRGTIYALEYSPDGKYFASAGDDAVIRVWSAETGKLSQMMIGHSGTINDVAWSPSSDRLVSASDDGTVRWWDAATGRLNRTVQVANARIMSVDWSPNGEFVGCGPDETLPPVILDAETGTRVCELTTGNSGSGELAPIRWSPTGEYVATRFDSTKVALWNGATFERSAILDYSWTPWRLDWTSDGRFLAAHSSPANGKKLVVWDVPKTEKVHEIPTQQLAMAWSPTRPRLAVMTSTNVAFFSLESEEAENWYPRSDILRHRVFAIRWSRDGTRLTLANQFGELVTIDAESGRVLFRHSYSHDGMTDSMDWDSRSGHLATGARDAQVHLWSLTSSALTAKVKRSQGKGNIKAVALSPDGERVASADDAGSILVNAWDGSAAEMAIEGKGDYAYLAWSSNDVIAGSGGLMSIWNGTSGKLIRELGGGPGLLRWSSDGNRLTAVGYGPGNNWFLSVWDPEQPEPVLQQAFGPSHSQASVAFSPDGEKVAIGHNHEFDCQIALWDVASGLRSRLLVGHAKPVVGLRWSDEKTLVSVSRDGTMRQWYTLTGEQVSSVPIVATEAEFSDDGKYVSTSLAAAVRIWEVESGRLNGTLLYMGGEEWAVVGGQGHVRTSEKVEPRLVYVALNEAGQTVYTPREFAAKFAWKNDPDAVRLIDPPASQGTPNPPVRPIAEPIETTPPLSPFALVTQPAKLKGVKSWSLESREPCANVHDIAFSPDSTLLATVSEDGLVRMYEPRTARLAKVIYAHGHAIRNVNWSPDGTKLCTGSEDGTARVWDYGSGKMLLELAGHDRVADQVQWSRDGSKIVTRDDQAVRVWNAADGQKLQTLQFEKAKTNCFDWLPNSRFVVTADDDKTIRFWDVAAGDVRLSFSSLHTREIAISSDGQRLFAAHDKELVEIDVRTGKTVKTYGALSLNPYAAYRAEPLQVSPDGKLAMCGAVYSISPEEAAFGCKGRKCVARTASWAPDSSLLAAADEFGVMVWDRTGNVVQQISAHTPVHRATWPTNERIAFSRLAEPFTDFQWQPADALIWDFQGERTIQSIETRHGVRDVSLSPSGDRVAVYGRGGPLEVRSLNNTESNPLVLLDDVTNLTSIGWSPDGKKIATSEGRIEPSKFKIWDIEQGVVISEVDTTHPFTHEAITWVPGGRGLFYIHGGYEDFLDLSAATMVKREVSGWVNTTSCTADGEHAAFGTSLGSVLLRKVDSGKVVEERLNVHRGEVWSVTHSPDGKAILSLGDDFKLVKYNTVTKRSTTLPMPAGKGEFSPDKQFLGCVRANAVRIVRTDDASPVLNLVALSNGQGLSISPQGNYRGTEYAGDFMVYVVETESGQEILLPAEFAQKYGWKNQPDLASGPGP